MTCDRCIRCGCPTRRHSPLGCPVVGCGCLRTPPAPTVILRGVLLAAAAVLFLCMFGGCSQQATVTSSAWAAYVSAAVACGLASWHALNARRAAKLAEIERAAAEKLYDVARNYVNDVLDSTQALHRRLRDELRRAANGQSESADDKRPQ